jgi:hypothetical protein
MLPSNQHLFARQDTSCTRRARYPGMLEALRFRAHNRVLAIGVVAGLILAACLAWLASGLNNGRSTSQLGPSAPASATPPVPRVTAPTTTPASPSPSRKSFVRTLPVTSSADVYAAAVAEALWRLNYAATSRDAVLAFWRAQLAPTLPAGTPAGTTLSQAQDAAISTISDYLPSAGMWPSLADDHTVSSFTVTGVSEPPSWVAAVTSGDIADPGLTARTVIGVQKLSYRAAGATRSTSQTQQVTVAMLCPPTTASCTVEIIPPSDSVDSLP